MSNPLLSHHTTKVALDALLEMYADPARAQGGEWHADPNYDDPLAMKGTEPENVKYGSDPVHVTAIWKYFKAHRVGSSDEIAHATGLDPAVIGPVLQEMGDMGFLRQNRGGIWQMLVGGGKVGARVVRIDSAAHEMLRLLEKAGGSMAYRELRDYNPAYLDQEYGRSGVNLMRGTADQYFYRNFKPNMDILMMNGFVTWDGAKGPIAITPAGQAELQRLEPLSVARKQRIQQQLVEDKQRQQQRNLQPYGSVTGSQDDKEAEAPLPVQEHDPVDPALNPDEKIFKRSLEAVLAAAGGKAFMFSNFRTAEDARDHLFETMRVASAPKTDFRSVTAWCEQFFPIKTSALHGQTYSFKLGEVQNDDSGKAVIQQVRSIAKQIGGVEITLHGRKAKDRDYYKYRENTDINLDSGERIAVYAKALAATPEKFDEIQQAVASIFPDAATGLKKHRDFLSQHSGAVDQKETPEFLPQRDDMRGHLDEDIKDDIKKMINAPVMQGAKGTHIADQTPDAPDAWSQKYPDSAQGAVACLAALSEGIDLKGATARPDPSVEGVWLVICKNGDRAVVYLAGYREPSGNRRDHNDFEVETQDDRDFAAEERKKRPDPYGVRQGSKTADLGTAMRDEDAQGEYFMDQVRDAKKEAYQAFLQDEFYQQEAQDNQWTMEELWAQIGDDFTNEYWQQHRGSYKKSAKAASCPNCKSYNVLPVQDLNTKAASGNPLQECKACGSFFTF